MRTIAIGNNQAGQRLDKFLHKYFPLAPMGFLYKMLRKKNITLNGKKASGAELLAPEDTVAMFFSEDTLAKFSGRGKEYGTEDASADSLVRTNIPLEDGTITLSGDGAERRIKTGNLLTAAYMAAYNKLKGITVVYEDEHFLFLNKPVGVLTQKAAKEDASLNEWMIGYLLAKDASLEKDLPTFRPSVCNRLDRNTSGIVLCGKSLPGLQFLNACIRERGVRKFYRTICVGEITQSKRLEGWLVKDTVGNKVKIISDKAAAGEGAALVQTAYTPIAMSEGYTLLEVELFTGKSHQIRAQMAAIGHPLIGDTKYGREEVNRRFREKYGLNYHLLHACCVKFPESRSQYGQGLGGKAFAAPCPESFLTLQKELAL